MSLSRIAFGTALGLGFALPALAQHGPIAMPCVGNITIAPQLNRVQVAPDGSAAWAVMLSNARNHSIAVVVTASGFPPSVQTPMPERRMVLSAGVNNLPLMMVTTTTASTPVPTNTAMVLDQQGAAGGPVIRVSQCTRW